MKGLYIRTYGLSLPIPKSEPGLKDEVRSRLEHLPMVRQSPA